MQNNCRFHSPNGLVHVHVACTKCIGIFDRNSIRLVRGSPTASSVLRRCVEVNYAARQALSSAVPTTTSSSTAVTKKARRAPETHSSSTQLHSSSNRPPSGASPPPIRVFITGYSFTYARLLGDSALFLPRPLPLQCLSPSTPHSRHYNLSFPPSFSLSHSLSLSVGQAKSACGVIDCTVRLAGCSVREQRFRRRRRRSALRSVSQSAPSSLADAAASGLPLARTTTAVLFRSFNCQTTTLDIGDDDDDDDYNDDDDYDDDDYNGDDSDDSRGENRKCDESLPNDHFAAHERRIP